MKIPLRPKPFRELMSEIQGAKDIEHLTTIFSLGEAAPGGKYRHWDTLRHLEPPKGLSHEEWWLGIKLARRTVMQPIPMRDVKGEPFRYALSDPVLRMVHEIDRDASGRIKISEQVTNPNTRDRYIISSLIEEAITSSQLEGASTTRHLAKEMIRTGRKPVDRSEQMIFNNFEAMRYIQRIARTKISADHLLTLHRIVTEDTLDEPDDAGRLRRTDDIRVMDPQGHVLHVPPPASTLRERLESMCTFANHVKGDRFIHPVVRAVLLHFWLAYDHPFVDGNGRTARALFYWSMLTEGYWLCEYLSISRILRAAPSKYSRSFLYTETDENDVTYFIIFQLETIRRAITELHRYLETKISEIRKTESLLRRSEDLNHRQLSLVTRALKDPGTRYTIQSHKKSHNVVYQTARADLLDLAEKGLLEKKKIGKTYVFFVPINLVERLKGQPATDAAIMQPNRR